MPRVSLGDEGFGWPAGTGTVDVTVTTPSDTSTTSSADDFTYEAE
ncbi:MAG: hypothetical protein ABSB99_05095 [Acidimicrobiales bacterium]|jgi:hypothetical protein